MLTLKQLRYLVKPVVLLNTAGFYACCCSISNGWSMNPGVRISEAVQGC